MELVSLFIALLCITTEEEFPYINELLLDVRRSFQTASFSIDGQHYRLFFPQIIIKSFIIFSSQITIAESFTLDVIVRGDCLFFCC
jgi:hypothetical protein